MPDLVSRSSQQLYDAMLMRVPEFQERWCDGVPGIPALWLSALDLAVLRCSPLGFRRVVQATPDSPVNGLAPRWSLPLRAVGMASIERIEMTGTAELDEVTAQRQFYSVGAANIHHSDSDSTIIEFPYPIAVTFSIRVTARWLPLPPSSQPVSAVIDWPWPELLLMYAISELYVMKFEEGALNDTMQAGDLAMTWRMDADALKQQVMISEGMFVADEEDDKKKSSRKKK